MRRKLRWITGALEWVEIIDHEGGAAPDFAKTTRFRRHVKTIDAELKTALRFRPRFQRSDVRFCLGVGSPVRALRDEIGGASRKHANDPPAVDDADARPARRHEGDRTALHSFRSVFRCEFDDEGRIRQQYRIFVGLRRALEYGSL